jgi:hypothetical protein
MSDHLHSEHSAGFVESLDASTIRQLIGPIAIFAFGCIGFYCLYVFHHDTFGEWANWVTFVSAWLGAVSATTVAYRQNEDRKRREGRITIKLRCPGKDDLQIPVRLRRGQFTRAELQGILSNYLDGQRYNPRMLRPVFAEGGNFDEVVRPRNPKSELIIVVAENDYGMFLNGLKDYVEPAAPKAVNQEKVLSPADGR